LHLKAHFINTVRTLSLSSDRANVQPPARQSRHSRTAQSPGSKKEIIMQIQINTDENIDGSEGLAARIETRLNQLIGRFSEHITRIEVHLSDQNADKAGGNDKRCLLEVRLEGRQPEVVSHQASTVEGAYTGAAKKLQSFLKSTLGRRNNRKGQASIRTEELQQPADKGQES
jgi:ribosome-associated translation inhibitor RaiA